MTTRRIVMSPVNEAALCVPNVLSKKANHIALLQIINTRSKVDIVLDEDRLCRRYPYDKSLMAASGIVIGQDPRYHTFALDLNIACTLLERTHDRWALTPHRRLMHVFTCD